MPERFCTMYEKYNFLSMGYNLSFGTRKCVNMNQESSSVIYSYKKVTNNISYTVRYGMGGKAL